MATARPPASPATASPGSASGSAGRSVSMFSPQVTTATSSATRTVTSVSTNWMYVVFAMIIDHDRSTASRPCSGAQPGCTQVTVAASGPSSHSAFIRSMSPVSKAS